MSELDIAERRVPQDGRFRVRYKGRNVDFRVSIMPTIHGEDAVIRILDKEQINESFRNLNLDVVGFAEDDLRKFRRYIAEPYGMVLVTGPTGSGKTTTLYAALNEIRNEEDKIVTIEDPVEYQLHGITQIPVNEKKGLTFDRGLRSILRHDPDKIMVGEIRDTETAQIAIQSALTGHLVLSTLHTPDVYRTVQRMLALSSGDPKEVRERIADVLQGIVAQRLVPRKEDQTRVLVSEVLIVTGTVREALKRPESNPPLKDLIEKGTHPYGMQTFEMHLKHLLAQGVIDVETARGAVGF